MHHHSTSTSARALRASTAGLILLTLASAAACRDDVTSPKPTSPVAPGGPQPAVIAGFTTLTVRIADIERRTINEPMAIKVFLDGSLTDTVTVWDATPADKEFAIGELRVIVPMRASYKVCAHEGSQNYAADFFDACKTVTGPGEIIPVGSVLAHRRPRVAFSLRTMSNAPLTGATVGWTTPFGEQLKFDDRLSPGIIISVLPKPGSTVFCEIKAPKGYQFTTPQCAAMDLAWDTLYTRTLKHEPLSKVQLP